MFVKIRMDNDPNGGADMSWLYLGVLVLALGGAAWWLLAKAGRAGVKPVSAKADKAQPGSHPPMLNGPGAYGVDVVGESYYRDNFLKLLGKQAGSDEEMMLVAVLTLDDANKHDANAVAVHVRGLQVGHLGKASARDFRAALKRDGLTQWRQFSVKARVYAGGDDKTFSVSVDLPLA
jgi:hypothetical protein